MGPSYFVAPGPSHVRTGPGFRVRGAACDSAGVLMLRKKKCGHLVRPNRSVWFFEHMDILFLFNF
jgi:hypothetical protein